jgi:hypothetical protein
MFTLLVALPDEDLEVLKTFSAARGISAAAVLAGHARRLRELVEGELHPDVAAVVGIIDPKRDGEESFLDHLEKKHS